MASSMGLAQSLAGLSFNERDSIWPQSSGTAGQGSSRYDLPQLDPGLRTWPSNPTQTPWETRPKESRVEARRSVRTDKDRTNRQKRWERADNRESEPDTEDDEEVNRRRTGLQRTGRSLLGQRNQRNDRDASYERQERSPYRAPSPPTRMTGLQVTKVLQSWHLSFDSENREEARNFLENVRDCKESNDIPTDKLLNAMPAILKGKAQRWFRENKRDLTTWIRFWKAFKDRYMNNKRQAHFSLMPRDQAQYLRRFKPR
ncbi:hypothetical protein TKK_0005558 [Trichogramma kaykai]|uniref:Retrotransposon gag domain-containing protein n=1 Tax=Trichogramma kaykai TaxID=54128 RepID=A0ABD2XI04_9HYME